MRRILPLLLFAALLGGCATTSHVMLSPARPAISPELVQVYTAPPPRYIEIALLETSSGPFTYGEQNKANAVIANLRREAASLGANGVLLTDTATGYRGGGVNVGVGGGRFGGRTHVGGGVGVDISPTQKHARAVAILVTP
ncbi:hypothetical protein [Cognatiluteimonas lumbrici]|uniref:hypothetical protein n=1 Tax=Cognatiluteimonas lumbrici TaxID=2559601 RepID=UPI00112B3724|nr:hypothetical protein [Luteimonas lumbrici]